MFKKESIIKMPAPKVDFHISFDSTISGNIKTKSDINVDGQVKGGICASGNVYIGSSATVDGNISGTDIHIAGTVNGDIDATGELVLNSSAKLTGNIKASGIRIEKDTKYEGSISVGMDNPKEFVKPAKPETPAANVKDASK
jgi:cytoskeletal protein CcmA (bactofilin family)